MLDLEALKTERDALRKARNKGVSQVEFSSGGVSRSVRYKTDNELRQALADLENQIAALEGRGARSYVVRSHKGWLSTEGA